MFNEQLIGRSLTFQLHVIVSHPDDDAAPSLDTFLMEIWNNQTVRDVQLLLVLLSCLWGGDLATLVVAPALVELIIPLGVEEKIFLLF